MATRPDTARTTVNEGVSEAIRATSQMSHLTLVVFNAYALAVEAAIKGTIAVLNAMFAAGMAFLDVSTTSSRTVAQQWTEAARQVEQAKLEVWQAGVSAGDGLPASASSGETSGQEDKGRKRS
jgi:hypothetical protein